MEPTTDTRANVYRLLKAIVPDKAPADDLANDDRSLDAYLDSFDMFTLIQDLEAQFNIEIADQDAGAENLGSVSRIVGFVQRKKGG